MIYILVGSVGSSMTSDHRNPSLKNDPGRAHQQKEGHVDDMRHAMRAKHTIEHKVDHGASDSRLELVSKAARQGSDTAAAFRHEAAASAHHGAMLVQNTPRRSSQQKTSFGTRTLSSSTHTQRPKHHHPQSVTSRTRLYRVPLQKRRTSLQRPKAPRRVHHASQEYTVDPDGKKSNHATARADVEPPKVLEAPQIPHHHRRGPLMRSETKRTRSTDRTALATEEAALIELDGADLSANNTTDTDVTTLPGLQVEAAVDRKLNVMGIVVTEETSSRGLVAVALASLGVGVAAAILYVAHAGWGQPISIEQMNEEEVYHEMYAKVQRDRISNLAACLGSTQS